MVRQSIRLLIVEDDPDDLLLLRRLLQAAMPQTEFRLEHADSFASAVMQLGRQFDLFLVSCVLGDNTGLDLLRELKVRGTRTPVILLTDEGQEEIALEALKAGAADCLPKSRLCETALRLAVRYAINLHRKEELLRRAHDELRASEKRFRALVENGSDLMVLLDREGTVLYASQSLQRTLGYAPAEAAGSEIFECVHPDDRATARQIFQAALAEPEKVCVGEVRMRHGDGSWRVMEGAVCNRLHEPAIAAVVVNGRDISERKAAEQEREHLLHELGGRIREATCLYAITNYVQVCDTIEQMLNCSAAAIPAGMHCREDAHARIVYDGREYTDPEFQPLRSQMAARLFVAGRACGVVEAGYSSPLSGASDEDSFPKQERDLIQVIARTLGSAIERKQAEQALRGSEERYRTLFERNMAGVFRASLSGELLECNDAFRRVLGYGSREEACGIKLQTLCVDAAQCEQAFHTLLQQGQVLNAELQLRRDHGSPVTVLMNVGLLRDSGGEPAGLEGTLIDVTEIYKLREQLLQSQKMDAIGKLAGGVAHDFNNLLTVIIGYCEMLQASRVDDRQRNQIRQVLTASRRAADLTRQLLAFSRKQVMTPQVISLNTMVRDLSDMLSRLIGEDIRLDLILADDLGETRADPTQMEQVVMNLAVNARDAMPHGGRLAIETANVVLDATYTATHAGLEPGRFAMLAVSDNGTGIEPEVLPHIFEPFFTTKERGKGTGLGLSTVYGIVQQSGGQIYVYSEPGRGTTFKVYLPCVQQACEPTDADVSAETDANGSGTILLVEDETGLREAAAEFLAGRGYSVMAARDGEEALNLAGLCRKRIDLLLTDVIMPGAIHGPELARRLLELRPEMRVLYMSGYTDSAIMQQGIKDPTNQFMQKPFSFHLLAKRVWEILEPPAMSAKA